MSHVLKSIVYHTFFFDRYFLKIFYRYLLLTPNSLVVEPGINYSQTCLVSLEAHFMFIKKIYLNLPDLGKWSVVFHKLDPSKFRKI